MSNARSFLAGVYCIVLSACSTGAAMRIEVEVYKGPLSRDFMTQIGELNGVIEVAHENLKEWIDTANINDNLHARAQSIRLELARMSCPAAATQAKISLRSFEDVAASSTKLDSVNDQLAAQADEQSIRGWFAVSRNANLANNAIKDADTVQQTTGTGAVETPAEEKERARLFEQKRRTAQYDVATAAVLCAKILLNSDDAEQVRSFASRAAQVATNMAGLGTWISTQELFDHSEKERRAEVIKLATIVGESSNQISARADVLLRLFEAGLSGKTSAQAAREMSTSDHLRDASTTEFLSLLDTLDAHNVNGDDEGQAKIDLSGNERVTLARQLFSDQNWTKINDVYASGQGDVRMAFIKDDIGNWNLKSFDSDPTELLDAYRAVTLAALGTLAKVAKGGNTDVNLERIQDLATDKIGTKEAVAATASDLKRERDQVVGNIQNYANESKKVKDEFQSRLDETKLAYERQTLLVESATAESLKAKSELADRNAEYLKALEDQRTADASAEFAATEDPKVKEARERRSSAEAHQRATAQLLVDAQAELIAVRKSMDGVLIPYQGKMQALVERAESELRTLMRINNALQKSAAQVGAAP